MQQRYKQFKYWGLIQQVFTFKCHSHDQSLRSAKYRVLDKKHGKYGTGFYCQIGSIMGMAGVKNDGPWYDGIHLNRLMVAIGNMVLMPEISLWCNPNLPWPHGVRDRQIRWPPRSPCFHYTLLCECHVDCLDKEMEILTVTCKVWVGRYILFILFNMLYI